MIENNNEHFEKSICLPLTPPNRLKNGRGIRIRGWIDGFPLKENDFYFVFENYLLIMYKVTKGVSKKDCDLVSVPRV